MSISWIIITFTLICITIFMGSNLAIVTPLNTIILLIALILGVTINLSLREHLREQLFWYAFLTFTFVEVTVSFTLILLFCAILYCLAYLQLSKYFLLLWHFRFTYYRHFIKYYFLFMNKMDKLFYSSFTRKIFFSFVLCSLGVIIYSFNSYLLFYWRLLCITFAILMIIHKCNYKLKHSIIYILIYILTILTFQYLINYFINNVDNIILLLQKLVINIQNMCEMYLSLDQLFLKQFIIDNLREVYLSWLDILSDNIYPVGQVFLAWLDENICYNFISKENKQNVAEFIVKLIRSNNWYLMLINDDNCERANDLLNINDTDFIINKMDNQGGTSKRPASPVLDGIDEIRKAKRPRSVILDNLDEIHISKRFKFVHFTSTRYDELENQVDLYVKKFEQEIQKVDKAIKFNSDECDKKVWDIIDSFFKDNENISMYLLMGSGVPNKYLIEMYRYALDDPRFYHLFFDTDHRYINNAVINEKFIKAFFCEYYDSEFKKRFYNDHLTVPQNKLESSFAFLEIFKLNSYRIQNLNDLFYNIDLDIKKAIIQDLELKKTKRPLQYQTKLAIMISEQTIINESKTK